MLARMSPGVRRIRPAPAAACRTEAAARHGRAASRAAGPRARSSESLCRPRWRQIQSKTRPRSAQREGTQIAVRQRHVEAGRRDVNDGTRGRAIFDLHRRPPLRHVYSRERCAPACGWSRGCSRRPAVPTGRPGRRTAPGGPAAASAARHRACARRLRRLHEGLFAREATWLAASAVAAAATSASDRPLITSMVPNGSDGLGTSARLGPVDARHGDALRAPRRRAIAEPRCRSAERRGLPGSWRRGSPPGPRTKRPRWPLPAARGARRSRAR